MNDRYTRHDSISGVQIKISYRKETNVGEPIPDHSNVTAWVTTTIDEWQGRKTTYEGINPPSPHIEL